MKSITTLVLLVGISIPACAQQTFARTGTSHASPAPPLQGSQTMNVSEPHHRTSHRRRRLVRSHWLARTRRERYRGNAREIARPEHVPVRRRRRGYFHSDAGYGAGVYNAGLLFGVPRSPDRPWPVWTEATVRTYSRTFGKTEAAAGPVYREATYRDQPVRTAPLLTPQVQSPRVQTAPVQNELARIEHNRDESVRDDSTGKEHVENEASRDELVAPNQTIGFEGSGSEPNENQSSITDQTVAEIAEEKRPPARLSLRPSGPLLDRPNPSAEEADDLVTLVFKDGRPPEHIRNYLLSRSTLSVVGKHYREIPVEELDMIATTKINQEAGVDFKLPDEER